MVKRFDISRSKKPYTCKEVIMDTKIPFEWEWQKGICPYCNKKISTTKNYILANVYIFENEEDIIYLADSTDGKNPMLLQLPDKKLRPNLDMTNIIKEKSKYLKEKDK